MSSIKSLGYYDNLIQESFIVENCGIKLSKLGRKIADSIIKVNLTGHPLVDEDFLRLETKVFVDFIQKQYGHPYERPLWYKLNVIDQAVNEYVGIGHLNIQTDWVEFLTKYLDLDRADQGGDTIIIIFDPDFKWAVSFTLSQDDSILQIEQYKK